MKRIVTSAHMKYLDDQTIFHHKIDAMVLMERAALSVIRHLQVFDLTRTLVVCGSGNNGGDGIAIARILHLMGRMVEIYFAGNPDRKSESCDKQCAIAHSYGIRWINNPDYSEYTTIIDALFGVGLSRTVSGHYADIIQKINYSDAKVLSVDMPSGVCADTGKILGTAVRADVTVTFAYEKVGQLVQPGKSCCGSLVIEDIGIYQIGSAPFKDYYSIEDKDLDMIPQRPSDGNKGTFGKVMLIAGSPDMPGASVLCGSAVMRTGAGMLKMVIPKENREIIVSNVPEAMLAVYDSEDTAIMQIEKGFAWADVVIIGPGLGMTKTAEKMVEYVMHNCSLPLVADADALNIISQHLEWLKTCKCPCILTPHIGEMARLLHADIADVNEQNLSMVQEFVMEYQTQCVLKDSVTLISMPNTSTFINRTGNCGMATAGSGDVLTGIIGGLLAVGTRWEYAGALGVWIHGRAGDICREKTGTAYLTASDLIKQLATFQIGEERG